MQKSEQNKFLSPFINANSHSHRLNKLVNQIRSSTRSLHSKRFRVPQEGKNRNTDGYRDLQTKLAQDPIQRYVHFFRTMSNPFSLEVWNNFLILFFFIEFSKIQKKQDYLKQVRYLNRERVSFSAPRYRTKKTVAHKTWPNSSLLQPSANSGYVYDAVWLFAKALGKLVVEDETFLQNMHSNRQFNYRTNYPNYPNYRTN